VTAWTQCYTNKVLQADDSTTLLTISVRADMPTHLQIETCRRVTCKCQIETNAVVYTYNCCLRLIRHSKCWENEYVWKKL